MSVESVQRAVVLPATPEEVWAALVDPARLSSWFGARVDLAEARQGATATFTTSDGVERGAVVEVVESRRCLVLRWLPFERTPHGLRPRPPSTIRFVLSERPGGTHLEVTESRPGDAPRSRAPAGLASQGAS